MQKRILVIGSNGFSGSAVVKRLAAAGRYDITGCSLSPDRLGGTENYSFVQADIRNGKRLAELFDAVRPHAVVNCAALSATDYCETHREEAYAMNVVAAENIARQCERHTSRLVHLSTDFVFDGKGDGLYTEEDTPAPVNYYGLTKLQSEQAVAATCTDWAIARIEVVYGPVLEGQHGNIVRLTEQRLRAGLAMKVVSDQFRTPTWVGDVAQGVELLLSHRSNGLYHVCGRDLVSIADMAFMTADCLRLDRSLITVCTTEEMQESVPRPRRSGMSCRKAMQELGYAPRSLDEGIKMMFGLLPREGY